jgi:CheY-like chemotaxis protein
MKILLIEDIQVERKIIRHWLEQDGHSVYEAADGGEGVQLFRTYRPDLVITDIVMPGKEGLETMTELRQEDPGVNIFAVSGAGRKEPGEYLKLARGLGALRTFVKPIDRADFTRAVSDLEKEKSGPWE